MPKIGRLSYLDIEKKYKKGVDKITPVCYNKDTKNKGDKNMRYRVVHPKYFPTYFKTKREALEFQAKIGGSIERKTGCQWYAC